ncbi:uncharacterized protein LOC128721112 [Anopheles nili]|uniref:uncharacterized protein LOC128721112 n=1 Tax=Anopheles nili TaxID=185578 RepID=UPI00237AEDD6|nr:uncharacterized protein LOC128721112 [Anopheles nili]
MVTGGHFWKTFFNTLYGFCIVAFIVAQQVIIYSIHLEQDFAGWFISTSILLTSFVIVTQALLSGKGLQLLMRELLQIESLLLPGRRWRFGISFYAMYAIGIARCAFRTTLLVQLGLRKLSVALMLVTPSLIVLVRINQQIFLMELIASHLSVILSEISNSQGVNRGFTEDQEQQHSEHSCNMLQRVDHLFGRLQKCLIMMNSLFGWSTAAIVVYLFINITFQFRTPMQMLPFYAQMVDVAFSTLLLLFLCKSANLATEKMNDIRCSLLKPFYPECLWDQLHNLIVRTKLQPFEFTANGLYSINYRLFGSTLAASATYVVIMFQFDQKSQNT